VKAITAKRTFAGIAALGAAALVLAGCAAAPEEVATPEAETEEATVETETVDFLACAVSDEGSWQDQSFNQAVYDGMQLVESELGAEVLLLESGSEADYELNMQAAVDADCDLTVAVGFLLDAAANSYAEANPDMKFAIVDSGSTQSNLKSLFYNVEQSAYLVGYASAEYSTSKILGTWGGINIPPVTAFMDGFYKGAKLWEQDNGTEVTILGWDPEAADGTFSGSFEDTASAKAVTATQIEAGADVIMPVAGGLYMAAAQAIDDSGSEVKLIGVDIDAALLNPDYAPYLITSVEKGMGKSVYDLVESLINGEEFNGDPYFGTLENGGTRMSPFYEFDSAFSDEVKARLAELQDGIIAGTVDPTVLP